MNTTTLLDDTVVDATTDAVAAALHDAASAVQHRQAHPPSTLDRVTLRLGLALILWSSRARGNGLASDDRERAARLGGLERARVAREESWLAAAHALPRR